MLFKLSLSNIRRSLRDYAIYFFTLIIGVSVFYVFNAIGGQAAMLQVTENRNDIVELLTAMLSGVSVFVAGVLGLLIVYASRFLMKRRNKEFALYLMLGMGKGKISAILLLETVIIGIGSLGVGLLVGIGLSQLMSALVVNLFEADMSAYRFSISGEAVVKTILFFAVMYLVVMIFNSGAVTRLKLIDLMNAGKRSEQIKLKNPWLCVIIFMLAAAALGYAYYQVGWRFNELNNKKIIIYIAMGAVSTFFIFWSISGMLLRVIMSMKSVYYRGLNSFTFRQISSKINTMVLSMTVICLMLFVTICTLSAAFCIRNSMNDNLKKLCPVDFELQFAEYHSDELQYVDIVQKFSDYDYDLTEDFSEYIHFHDYCDKDFTFASFLDDHLDQMREKLPYMDFDFAFPIVRISDYNELMQLYGRDQLTLDDGEFILICNFKSTKDVMDDVLEKEYEINACGHTLSSRYDCCQDGFIDISSQHLNIGFFVVSDSVADEKYAGKDYFIGNYNAETKNEKRIVEENLNNKYKDFFKKYTSDNNDPNVSYMYSMNTKIDISEATIGLGAIGTFLGLYIGLVFLIACGAILALKELSESVDSIGRYEMLRKIGVDECDISKSLFRQTGIFFLLPVLFACIHSVFGMKFATFFLEIFGTEKMTESTLSTSAIILLIYGGYFLITYFCSKSIIKERK